MLPSDQNGYVSFGDVCRDLLGMQCQYGSRYADPYYATAAAREKGERQPYLAEGLDITGDPDNYHFMRIHQDSVEPFVARVVKHNIDEWFAQETGSPPKLENPASHTPVETLLLLRTADTPKRTEDPTTGLADPRGMTTTAEQRERAFRADLAELLAKHSAELQVTDDGRSYGMQSGVCRITMDGTYDKAGEVVQEFTEFQL